MAFCNSCGRPMGRNDYGTNEDGSPNMDYCKDCFQNGEFTEPDITINEMIIRHAKRMMRNPNPDDEIEDEDEPVMGYRGNARDML